MQLGGFCSIIISSEPQRRGTSFFMVEELLPQQEKSKTRRKKKKLLKNLYSPTLRVYWSNQSCKNAIYFKALNPQANVINLSEYICIKSEIISKEQEKHTSVVLNNLSANTFTVSLLIKPYELLFIRWLLCVCGRGKKSRNKLFKKSSATTSLLFCFSAGGVCCTKACMITCHKNPPAPLHTQLWEFLQMLPSSQAGNQLLHL